MTDPTDTTGKTALLETLAPVLQKVAELDPQNQKDEAAGAALVAAMEAAFPADGQVAERIRQAIERGIEEGWVCHRGEPDARFSRLAKPTPETHDLSIDVVSLRGPAVRHTHPGGEVTLGFATADTGDSVTFDGQAPGWVFCRPGSTHTPTVEGGRMNLIYFLPHGAVEWLS